MSRSNLLAPPTFLNVTVSVEPCPNGGGNSADGKFQVTCTPATLPVYRGDAVINYQLVDPTPLHFVFIGFDKARPYPSRQLSAPSISVDGKMMTFSDRNSECEPILITLKFCDNSVIMFDPEVSNDPVPGL